MIRFAKAVLKKTPLYAPLKRWQELRNDAVQRREAMRTEREAAVRAERELQREMDEWIAAGRPVPPPHHHKQRVLREYADKYGLRVFVETGTCFGDTVEAMRPHFECVYSIELSDELHSGALQRFEGVPNVVLIHGDSASQLDGVLSRIDQPTLFWLDGHYSGGVTARGDVDTPILAELATILESPDRGHVLVIDDARCFGADPAYPSIDELRSFIKKKRSGVDFEVLDDMIRVTPGRESARP
jgi:hypothetical protein